jgi:tRNA A-37 threonylcarbamoyl transferase component Bud32
VRELPERAYFLMCFAFGRLLRAARYSNARTVDANGGCSVHKSRVCYAPFIISIGNLLLKILDTGVQVLQRRDWEERERQVYQSLYGTAITIDANGVIVMPLLAGRTLANLLEDPSVDQSHRKMAIERATTALAEFHNLGLTHGDAMAENVLVDRTAGVANWFDFETIHDSSRPMIWRRADDVRALLFTCLVRTLHEQRAEALEFILDIYRDRSRRIYGAATRDEVSCVVAANFTSVWRRSLTFHLAQAGMSFRCCQDIAELLGRRALPQR